MRRLARVLVADDDPDMLAAVSDVFAREGSTVICASSGAEMVQRVAKDGPFDLIVTDISMPWMNGVQVARTARNAGMTMPIIVMTALGDPQLDRLADQLRSLGDNVRVLRKPFELADLDRAVETLLPSTP